MTLGELCDINTGKKLNKSDIIKGNYPVIGGGKIIGYHNEYNRYENELIISRVGDCNVKYMNINYYLTDNAMALNSINEHAVNKYIYYYLLTNLYLLERLYNGTAQKVISKTNISNIQIPVPSLERQEYIIEYLSFIHEKRNKTLIQSNQELKKLNEYYIKNQMLFGKYDTQTLVELCDIKIGGTPLRSNKDYYTNGHNVWVSVRELNKNIILDSKEKITDLGVSKSNVKLLKKDTILISFKLSIGKLAIAGCDLYTNEAIAGLNSKNINIIKNLYLYYYLMSYDFKNAGTGLIGTGSMNSKSLGELIIPVPPIEYQEKYIKYCENNQKEIENNQKEIENNQKEIENNTRIASEFLNKMI
jgi:type I restriction enzyme M protein